MSSSQHLVQYGPNTYLLNKWNNDDSYKNLDSKLNTENLRFILDSNFWCHLGEWGNQEPETEQCL